jgi:hypothetical protein
VWGVGGDAQTARTAPIPTPNPKNSLFRRRGRRADAERRHGQRTPPARRSAPCADAATEPESKYANAEPESDGAARDGAEAKPGDDGDDGVLRRRLGFADGVGVVVGIMIGSGIFASPGVALAAAGSPARALAAWALAAALVAVASLAYSEARDVISERVMSSRRASRARTQREGPNTHVV